MILTKTPQQFVILFFSVLPSLFLCNIYSQLPQWQDLLIKCFLEETHNHPKILICSRRYYLQLAWFAIINQYKMPLSQFPQAVSLVKLRRNFI